MQTDKQQNSLYTLPVGAHATLYTEPCSCRQTPLLHTAQLSCGKFSEFRKNSIGWKLFEAPGSENIGCCNLRKKGRANGEARKFQLRICGEGVCKVDSITITQHLLSNLNAKIVLAFIDLAIIDMSRYENVPMISISSPLSLLQIKARYGRYVKDCS